MMENIKTCLTEADPDRVKLYFIERDKNQKTKVIHYNTLKTVITSQIGSDLISAGLRQLETLLDGNPECMEYGIVSSSDRLCVETITKNEVPYLSELITQVSNPDLEEFNDTRINKIFGYIVKIEYENKTLFLFRKHTPKKLLEKGVITMLFREGGFERLNSQIMAIDEEYDATLLLEEGADPSQSKVFIFNRSKFESVFSFVDFYDEETENKREEIIRKGFLDDVNVFIDCCKSDSRAIKKLARILNNGALDRMSKEKIDSTVRDYHLSLEFDASGKIIVNKGNIWTVLRILDDDYVRSDATDTKYEARSKVKK
jgi:frataxin-like iron-binding protein CyaY